MSGFAMVLNAQKGQHRGTEQRMDQDRQRLELVLWLGRLQNPVQFFLQVIIQANLCNLPGLRHVFLCPSFKDTS